MDTESFYTRQMLLQYGKQLVTARRIARYERMLGRTQEVPAGVSSMRRQMMVERVAREITENLIFSGSDNLIVQQVLEVLQLELGETLFFRYPPGEFEFKVFRLAADGQEIELKPEEKRKVMDKAWEVALRVVDATML